MVRYTCSECGGDVTIDTSHLGPWGGRGLQSPVRILCFDCVRRLGLELRGDGAHRWFLRGGEEWREYPGAFARSDDPSVRGIYHRDER